MKCTARFFSIIFMPTSRPFIGSIIITKQILQTINSFDKKQHQNIFQLFQNLFEDVYICFIVNVFIRCKCFLLLSTKFCTTSNNMGVKTDCAQENEVYLIYFFIAILNIIRQTKSSSYQFFEEYTVQQYFQLFCLISFILK